MVLQAHVQTIEQPRYIAPSSIMSFGRVVILRKNGKDGADFALMNKQCTFGRYGA